MQKEDNNYMYISANEFLVSCFCLLELHVATTQNLVCITVVYCVVMMQVAWRVLLVMCGHNAITTEAWKILLHVASSPTCQILKLHLVTLRISD